MTNEDLIEISDEEVNAVTLKEKVSWAFDGMIERGVWYARNMKQELLETLDKVEQQQQEIERLKSCGSDLNNDLFHEKMENNKLIHQVEQLKKSKQTFIIIYKNEISLVTTDPHEVAEHWNNNYRDKLQVWQDGKLVEERI
ncbi:hypothetical protein [Cytobacillus sp.]|uniref:hypothetical protein n=1 Tax=Cytobacillus sp. TaxID=2675269 RepID=UPI0028BE6267|nr:hypothetical protein [Cytobacillus sp.]